MFVFIAHIKLSFYFSFLYIFFNFKRTLEIINRESRTFLAYLLIIVAILINDLAADANITDTIKAVLLHFFSFYIFIFFLSVFSKHENNFPRFLIIFSIALLFYQKPRVFFGFV